MFQSSSLCWLYLWLSILMRMIWDTDGLLTNNNNPLKCQIHTKTHTETQTQTHIHTNTQTHTLSLTQTHYLSHKHTLTHTHICYLYLLSDMVDKGLLSASISSHALMSLLTLPAADEGARWTTMDCNFSFSIFKVINSFLIRVTVSRIDSSWCVLDRASSLKWWIFIW